MAVAVERRPQCLIDPLDKRADIVVSGDVDEYCARFLDPENDEIRDTVIAMPDGRSIRLISKRSPDGGWATTLEDVTERRRVEA